MEKEYYEHNLIHSLKLIRFTLIWSSILMLGFTFVTKAVEHSGVGIPFIESFTLIRVLIVTPFIMATFFMTYIKKLYPYLFAILSFSSCIVALGICVRIAFSPHAEWGQILTYAGLILILIVVNTGYQMRFTLSLFTGLVIILMYFVSTHFFITLSPSSSGRLIYLANTFFLMSSEILCLVISYFGEYNRRNVFLLQRKVIAEKEEKQRMILQNWKHAYRIYSEINKDVFLERFNAFTGMQGQNGSEAEEYFNRLKGERISASLAELLNSFGAEGCTGDIYGKIMDTVMEKIGADRGCIVLRKGEADSYNVVIQRSLNTSDPDFINAVIKMALETKEAVMMDSTEILPDGVRRLLCFPVEYSGEILGACYLDTRNERFDPEGEQMVNFLVSQLIFSLKYYYPNAERNLISVDLDSVNALAKSMGLTEREIEVLLLLLNGVSNKGICERCFISLNTLRTHLKNINGKAGVSDRQSLIRIFGRYESTPTADNLILC